MKTKLLKIVRKRYQIKTIENVKAKIIYYEKYDTRRKKLAQTKTEKLWYV